MKLLKIIMYGSPLYLLDDIDKIEDFEPKDLLKLQHLYNLSLQAMGMTILSMIWMTVSPEWFNHVPALFFTVLGVFWIIIMLSIRKHILSLSRGD